MIGHHITSLSASVNPFSKLSISCFCLIPGHGIYVSVTQSHLTVTWTIPGPLLQRSCIFLIKPLIYNAQKHASLSGWARAVTTKVISFSINKLFSRPSHEACFLRCNCEAGEVKKSVFEVLLFRLPFSTTMPMTIGQRVGGRWDSTSLFDLMSSIRTKSLSWSKPITISTSTVEYIWGWEHNCF